MGVNASCCATEEVPATEPLARGNVEVYGVTVSANAMGPVLLVTSKSIGVMVPTMPGPDGTQKPEFLAMNPFHAIPTLKDGDLVVAESSAILRYLSTKYAPELYADMDAKRRGFIDWAMDNFAGSLYKDAQELIYPCLGFKPPPEDREAAAKTALDNLNEWAGYFLVEKFVGGDTLSIADYKVAPFLFCYTHPALQEQAKLECPERVKQYVKDFLDACPAANMLSSAGGYSLKEVLDSKRVSAGTLDLVPRFDVAISTSDIIKGKSTGSGKMQVYGVPPSSNSMGPVLVGMDLGCIEFVPTMPGEGTRTPEFLAMNPFHAVPTLKDGDYSLAESAAIMRYLAATQGPELYPNDAAKRARIDWAIDNFATGMYADAPKTLYPCLGFCPFPPDTKEVGKALSQKLKEYADFFLNESKFVVGDQLSIADYKVAPFFYAWEHPMLKAKCDVEVPARISQFNKDFGAASASAGMFQSANGYALKEMLDKAHAEQ